MIEKAINKQAGTAYLNSVGVSLACFAIVILILLADLLNPLGVAIDVLYVMVIGISLLSSRKSFIVAMAVVCSVLTIGVFFYQPDVPEMWKVIFNRGLALFAIWMTALLGLTRKISEENREKAVEDREKALEETRVLRGFLPICASCKKIRDVDGYWTQMEEYIRDHSEADFSHGICPECAKKLYPQLYK
ncbi:MAG: hypothetical protein K4571_00390 [Deltaproteobacteria bacterium]